MNLTKHLIAYIISGNDSMAVFRQPLLRSVQSSLNGAGPLKSFD
jgi:hypothetical protein